MKTLFLTFFLSFIFSTGYCLPLDIHDNTGNILKINELYMIFLPMGYNGKDLYIISHYNPERDSDYMKKKHWMKVNEKDLKKLLDSDAYILYKP